MCSVLVISDPIFDYVLNFGDIFSLTMRALRSNKVVQLTLVIMHWFHGSKNFLVLFILCISVGMVLTRMIDIRFEFFY